MWLLNFLAMLSLLLNHFQVNLTNVRRPHKKLCFFLGGFNNDVTVNTAQLYLVNKDIDTAELDAVKNYLLNPVDSRFKDITTGIAPQAFSESDKTIPNLDFFKTYTAASNLLIIKLNKVWRWKLMTLSLSKSTSNQLGACQRKQN